MSMATKKQLRDEPYYIPRAEELAAELGATVEQNTNGRQSATWNIIHNGVSYTAHDPEAALYFLPGVQHGLKALLEDG